MKNTQVLVAYVTKGGTKRKAVDIDEEIEKTLSSRFKHQASIPQLQDNNGRQYRELYFRPKSEGTTITTEDVDKVKAVNGVGYVVNMRQYVPLITLG
tara:strand:- start:2210 stop:2500 length:291 start_codon:yes stop_codon:yes gene_type:complete